MEKKYIENRYTKEICPYAKAAYINEEIRKSLTEYINTGNSDILYNIMDEKPAYTIDIIYKETVRKYNKNYLNKEFKQFTKAFTTDYKLYDRDKVFFTSNKLNNDLWTIIITVYKKGDKSETNFFSHNYFYEPLQDDVLYYLNSDNLLCRCYQDMTIISTEKLWKNDLIVALYKVIVAAYWWWKEKSKNIKK